MMVGLPLATKREPTRSLYTAYYWATLPLRVASWLAAHFLTASYRRHHTLLESLLVQSYRSVTELWTRTAAGPRGAYLGASPSPRQTQSRIAKSRAAWTRLRAPAQLRIAEGVAASARWRKVAVQDVEANRLGERASSTAAATATGKQTPAQPGERVILFLHGGAYVIGSADPSNPAATLPLHLLDAVAKTSPASRGRLPRSALAPELRLTHLAPWPAPLLDALIAWHHLVDELGFRPKDVVVLGDSSGAHLALALTRYLKRHLGVLPGANVVPSPWVDPSGSINTHTSSWWVNAADDSLPDIFVDEALVSMLPGVPRDARDFADEYFSPGAERVYRHAGDDAAGGTVVVPEEEVFAGWCPVHIIIGTRDREYDHALRLASLLRHDTRNVVRLHAMRGVPHDPFQYPPGAFQAARDGALAEAVSWLADVVYPSAEGAAE